jgi:peptidoglycan/LPS O-acetylase OafA/YrhL
MKSQVIQVLRFLASALVVTTHATFYFSERVDQDVRVWTFGAIGVPIFFFISGLVMIISTVPLPVNARGAVQFFRRRIIRIVPLYWAVTLGKVVIAISLPFLIYHNHFDPIYALKSLLFIPAFNTEGEVRPIHGVGWTLYYEMFFYLAFAGAMACRLRPVWSVSILLVALYLSGYLWPPTTPIDIVLTNSFNLCFVLGMLLGQLVVTDRDQSRRVRGAAMACTLLLSISVVARPSWVESISPIDVWVVIVALLAMLCIRVAVPARAQLFVRLGDSSYALYLLHPLICPAFIIFFSKLVGAGTPAWPIAMAVAATIWVSHVFHVLIERRLTAMARRVWPDGLRSSSMGRSVRPAEIRPTAAAETDRPC